MECPEKDITGMSFFGRPEKDVPGTYVFFWTLPGVCPEKDVPGVSFSGHSLGSVQKKMVCFFSGHSLGSVLKRHT